AAGNALAFPHELEAFTNWQIHIAFSKCMIQNSNADTVSGVKKAVIPQTWRLSHERCSFERAV
ncbi:MAG: hypothetical protein E7H98_10620, partial [Finegoldia magna]|nr:hypothetical protein [Finegoldia magna]